MTEKERLLSKLLPEIDCPDGCTLCCEAGLSIELQHSGEYGVLFSDSLRSCDNLVNDKCAVFYDRPFSCRLFFKAHDDFECLGNLKPKGGGLCGEEMRQIMWCWVFGTDIDARAIYAFWRET